MIFIPALISSLIASFIIYKNYRDEFIQLILIFVLISFAIIGIVYGINISMQTSDKEVWSGRIEAVNHEEEWDETVTETHTDDKGNVSITTKTVHHNAENSIKTSDDGWISVYKSQDGKVRFDDRYPNTNKELETLYPIGTPTASVHRYENKVKSSYSIYKHNDINLKDYEDLPKYPMETKGLSIDRFIGDIDNRESILGKINEVNSDLNSKEKKKQVNLIFVNLGDKSEDYGFAIQDYWQGGNKNDFVVSFATEEDKIKWVYPFSWADNESSERLKINIRDYLINKGNLDEFESSIDDIGKMIESDFKRKEFADFNYINIEITKGGYEALIVVNLMMLVALTFFTENSIHYKKRRR